MTPQSGKLPVSLLTGQNQVFRLAGATRCTDSRQTWQGQRAPGSTYLCKISPQSAQGVGMRPQNTKKFHFLVKSCLAGANPWPISKIFRGFYTPNYPTLVFQIWRDSLHRLRSYCWETARRSIRPNFPCTLQEKLCVGSKMFQTFFDGLSELYHRAKFAEDRTTRAGCRFENMAFVFCHAPSPDHCAFEGCIVQPSIVWRFMGRFWCGFYLYSEGIGLSDAVHDSHFRR